MIPGAAVRGSGCGHGHGGRGTLARRLEWLLGSARETGSGLAWTGRDDAARPRLYSGAAGIGSPCSRRTAFRDDRSPMPRFSRAIARG